MGTIVNVPSNLDFEGINPLINLPTINTDYLYYFCGELIHMRAMYGSTHPEYGDYFPLCSERLRDIYFNYNQVMDYLLKADVLATDGWFVRGEKCTGYKFTETYSGQPLKQYPIENYVLNKNIKKRKAKRDKEA